MARDLVRVVIALLCVASIVVSAATLPLATVGSNASNGSGGFGSFGGASPSDQGVGAPENTSLVEDAIRESVDQAGIVTTSNQNDIGGPVGAGTAEALSAQVMFTVDAEQPTYWREGAYTTYTGSGWSRPDDARPLDGEVYPNAEGRRLEQTVTAKSTMTVVPTAWKPVSVSGAAADGAQVTPRGAVRVSEPIERNETYTVVSRVNRPSPDELRGLGTDYPAAVSEGYTALPDSLPDRVVEKSDEITAGDDDPYAQAAAIEAWLEANKEYDLNASKPEGDFVDGFLFEQDEGYCEYFATSMVVMLRTQGIPARYVTGFSPGQPGADGQYVVRGMNAHAWVEVYFPEEGWVRFDPTPATDRLQTEQSALEEARSGGEEGVDTPDTENQTYDPEDPTSPGEINGTDGPVDGNESTGNESGDPGAPDDGDIGGDDPAPPDDGETRDDPTLNVSVAPEPEPGREATVTVTRGGDPVPDTAVYFNDERVGVTDATGAVTATVPYVANLTITVVENATTSAGAVPPPVTVDALAGTTPDDGPTYAPASAELVVGAAPDNETNESSETYELVAEVGLSAPEGSVPGEDVRIRATVNDRPLPEAEVTVDGRFVGTTDADGELTISMPYRDSATVAVQRGDLSAETTVDVDTSAALSIDGRLVPNETVTVTATVAGEPLRNAPVSVNGTVVAETGPNGTATVEVPYRDPLVIEVGRDEVTASTTRDLDATLALSVTGGDYPGDAVAVRATVAGDPVAGAPVRVGNETVATTGPNGEATLTAPFRNSLTVETTQGSLTATGTVDWILLPVGVGGALLVGYGALLLARRQFGVAEDLPVTPRELVGLALSLVIGVAGWVARRVDGAVAIARRLRERYRRADTIGAFLRSVVDAARAGVGARWAALRAWVAARRGGTPDEADFEEAVDEVVDAAEREDVTITIEEAWERMVRRLDVPNPSVRTPGEYARWAVEAGMPAEEVHRLTRVFRDAEYGVSPPDESDGQTASEAIEGIERGSRSRGDPTGGDD
jgi:transglutaminase-like putative cysteine protease